MLEYGPRLVADVGAGAHSRGSRLGLGSQGSGTFAVTPLQRLLSPSFLTPDTTFRLPGETAQVRVCPLAGDYSLQRDGRKIPPIACAEVHAGQDETFWYVPEQLERVTKEGGKTSLQ